MKCAGLAVDHVRWPWRRVRPQRAKEGLRKRELDSYGRKRALRRERRYPPDGRCTYAAGEERGQRRERCPR
eukprot:4052361-Pleurochrysis_carterae.AAC.1